MLDIEYLIGLVVGGIGVYGFSAIVQGHYIVGGFLFLTTLIVSFCVGKYL